MRNCIYQCSGFTINLIWLAVQYVYVLLVQVAAFILAIITRKVEIKVLNDSKEMFAIVYLSTPIIILLGLITFVFNSRFILNEVLFCGGVMIITTVFLGLLFVPKVRSLEVVM